MVAPPHVQEATTMLLTPVGDACVRTLSVSGTQSVVSIGVPSTSELFSVPSSEVSSERGIEQGKMEGVRMEGVEVVEDGNDTYFLAI